MNASRLDTSSRLTAFLTTASALLSTDKDLTATEIFNTLLAGTLCGRTDRTAVATARHTARQTARVISVVVIGVVALIGVLIFGEVYAAMQDPLSGTPLNSTADQIVSGFGNAMGFVPIILIVLLAAVVIAVVRGL